jgi:hypothetical protein
MRALLVIAALSLVPVLARAQVCPPPNCTLQCPMADVFLAYEPTSEKQTGVFRTINACDPPNATALAFTPPAPLNLPPLPLLIAFLNNNSFSLQELVGKLLGSGPLAGLYASVRTSGFHHPVGAFMVTDLCGTHIISVGSPVFASILADGRKVICFQEKNLNNVPPPPGFDRSEEVCVVLP